MKSLLIDPLKCKGCGRCEVACSFEHDKEFNPAKSRIGVLRRKEIASAFPTLCLQCSNPLCAIPCPTNAISKDEKTGVVDIDPDLCVGCSMCVIACPLGAISISLEGKTPVKCDECGGGEPACAKACEYGAIEYIEMDEANIIRRRRGIEKLSEMLNMIEGGKK